MKKKANVWNVGESFEENMSVCKIAFMNLVKKYDIKKRKAFITLLGIAIDGDFKNIIRNKMTQKKTKGYEVSLEETVGYGRDDKEIRLEDSIEDTKVRNLFERVERIELIKQILLDLTEEERDFVYNALIKGKKQRELSLMYGTAQSNINKRLKRIKNKMHLIALKQLAC